MSIEILVSVFPAENSVVAVTHALAQSLDYEVVGSPTDRLLSLRFRTSDAGASWEEDVVLEAVETGILISFHSATASQRERVLKSVTEALLAEGRSSSFEEL